MRAAFVMFEGMTALDFVGAYDPLTRLRSMRLLPDFEWDLCAFGADVSDDKGLAFKPDLAGEPLDRYDLIVVPGGFATRTLKRDKAFIDWLRTADIVGLKASVCTGSLLLGAAGFLKHKRATTHPSAFEELRPYCAEVLDRRVVDEGDIVTARGVASALDLGLYLVERLAGPEARTRIARQMDYPYFGHALTRARPAQNPHNPGGAPLVRSCATGGGSP
jgi:transcriptional regulator GlxA family with amidase domain